MPVRAHHNECGTSGCGLQYIHMCIRVCVVVEGAGGGQGGVCKRVLWLGIDSGTVFKMESSSSEDASLQSASLWFYRNLVDWMIQPRVGGRLEMGNEKCRCHTSCTYLDINETINLSARLPKTIPGISASVSDSGCEVIRMSCFSLGIDITEIPHWVSRLSVQLGVFNWKLKLRPFRPKVTK